MQKESQINIDVGGITVNAQTNASAKDIASEIDNVLRDRLSRPNPAETARLQRNISEANALQWSYGGGG
jgi:hypothetical protein